jgi:PKD repeat protein
MRKIIIILFLVFNAFCVLLGNEKIHYLVYAGPTSGGFFIRPKSMSGQVNIAYQWTASLTPKRSNIKYEWDFGDGSAKEIKLKDSIITHTYTKAGSYKIKLVFYDSINAKIGKAEATAKIVNLVGAAKTVKPIVPDKTRKPTIPDKTVKATVPDKTAKPTVPDKTSKPIIPDKTTKEAPPDIKTPIDILIFNNSNIYGVNNNPSKPTEFTIDKSYYITSIQNYHWNNGKGDPPGSIGLKKDGVLIGNWKVTKTIAGQGGVPDANWICYPNIIIQPGKYTIIDSRPSTWSTNSGSGYAGFSQISGYVK